MSEGQPGKERRKAGCDHQRRGQLTFSSCSQEALKRAPGRSTPANRTQQNGEIFGNEIYSIAGSCWGPLMTSAPGTIPSGIRKHQGLFSAGFYYRSPALMTESKSLHSRERRGAAPSQGIPGVRSSRGK